MSGAYCPECAEPMHMGSDGFYFHEYPRRGIYRPRHGLPCSIRATLDPVDEDGNYPDEPTKFYEPPADRSYTVFDPYDATFGPIMAAIQEGEFETAVDLLAALVDRTKP